jgi:hypothetical protein
VADEEAAERVSALDCSDNLIIAGAGQILYVWGTTAPLTLRSRIVFRDIMTAY